MIYTSTIRREQLLDINCYDGAVSNLVSNLYLRQGDTDDFSVRFCCAENATPLSKTYMIPCNREGYVLAPSIYMDCANAVSFFGARHLVTSSLVFNVPISILKTFAPVVHCVFA